MAIGLADPPPGVDPGQALLWIGCATGAVGALGTGPGGDGRVGRLAAVGFVAVMGLAVGLAVVSPAAAFDPPMVRSLLVWGPPIVAAIGASLVLGGPSRWGRALLLCLGSLLAWSGAQHVWGSGPPAGAASLVASAGAGGLILAIAAVWGGCLGGPPAPMALVRSCGALGLPALAFAGPDLGTSWLPWGVASGVLVVVAFVDATDRPSYATALAALASLAGLLWAMGSDLFGHPFCGFICSACGRSGRFALVSIALVGIAIPGAVRQPAGRVPAAVWWGAAVAVGTLAVV